MEEADIFSERVVNLLLSFLFIGSNAGYFFVGHWAHPFLGLWGATTIQFLLFGILVWRARRGLWLSWPLILLVAGISRGVLWFSDPILENDYWRYLWDGRVLAHGINPYLYAPMDPALDALDTGYRSLIGWGRFGTIYPPLAEFLFAVTHFIAGDSLLGLKVMLTCFDLGIGMLLFSFLGSRGGAQRWVFLYLLNPLVLKEIANSAHLDSIPVFFSMAAIYCMTTMRSKGSTSAWVLLALGAGAKLYPLVLVPLFARLDPCWKRGVGIFAMILLGMYLPFISAGAGLFGGTGAYAKYWIFNASVFKLVAPVVNSLVRDFWMVSSRGMSPFIQEALANDYPAKVLLGGFFCCGLIWQARKLIRPQDLPEASLKVLGLLLILSPVVDAWYVLWVLPLACLLRSIPWLAFSYLVIGSYSWFYSKDLAPFFRTAEYGAFFILLALGLIRERLQEGSTWFKMLKAK